MDDEHPWRFKPGRSGNPAGRPKGRRNRATVLREALAGLGDTEIVERTVAQAKRGNPRAVRLLFNVLLPPARHTIELDLPDPTTAQGLSDAMGEVLRAMCAGEIAPDDALRVGRVLQARHRAA